MDYRKDTKRGRYIVENTHKYIGTKHPVFKSTWEQRLFYMFDHNPYVKKWGYECQPLPYYNPVYKKQTIYYPDLFVHIVDQDGSHKNFLIEVKPFKFTHAPELPKLKTYKALDRYKKAQAAYLINVSKWQAAEVWCAKHKVIWMIVTENTCSKFLASSGGSKWN